MPKIAQPEPKAKETDSGFSAAELENGMANYRYGLPISRSQ